ncbi:MAG: tail fiber domain-containing protein [Hyphomicrobiaceae bacterium]
MLLLAAAAMPVQAEDVVAEDALASSEGLSTPTYNIPGVEIGGFVTEDGGSGEVNAIVPLALRGSHAALFLGADAKFIGNSDDLGDGSYNVGAYLGYRTLLDNGSGVLGLWLGADTMRTRYDHTFQRFIAGAEYFGPRIIARINGFTPFDDTSGEWAEVESRTTVTAAQRTVTTITSVYDEKTPSGFDAEAGLRFAMPALVAGRRPGELRLFAGIYDYMGLDEDGGDVIGGRGRVELDLYPFEAAPNTRLTLEASYSNDAHYDDQVAGGVRLSIPLGEPARHASASYGGGSLKDGPGSLKDSDPAPAYGRGGGQDLFQPVRRNNRPVSVRRLKSRTIRTAITNLNSDEPVEPPVEVGFTLANVCGGPSAPIQLIWPDFGDPDVPPLNMTVLQNAVLGAPSDFSVLGAPTTLNLASFINATGQTLAELLASSPETFSGTFTLPPLDAQYFLYELTPDFVGPDAWNYFGGVYAAGFILTVNGNSCTLEVDMNIALASDRRLKRDIELLATLDDGTRLYSFRYIENFDASGNTYVGVMAQDILAKRPDAVATMADGHYAVRYGRLGLRMATLAEWQRDGLRAVQDLRHGANALVPHRP